MINIRRAATRLVLALGVASSLFVGTAAFAAPDAAAYTCRSTTVTKNLYSTFTGTTCVDTSVYVSSPTTVTARITAYDTSGGVLVLRDSAGNYRSSLCGFFSTGSTCSVSVTLPRVYGRSYVADASSVRHWSGIYGHTFSARATEQRATYA